MKIKDIGKFELEFTALINSFLKNIGGKGPKQTEVRFTGDMIVYFIRGILTEREKMLLNHPEGKKNVMDSRRMFTDMHKERRNKMCEQFIGHKIIESYETWNLENDSAVVVLLLDESIF